MWVSQCWVVKFRRVHIASNSGAHMVWIYLTTYIVFLPTNFSLTHAFMSPWKYSDFNVKGHIWSTIFCGSLQISWKYWTLVEEMHTHNSLLSTASLDLQKIFKIYKNYIIQYITRFYYSHKSKNYSNTNNYIPKNSYQLASDILGAIASDIYSLHTLHN